MKELVVPRFTSDISIFEPIVLRSGITKVVEEVTMSPFVMVP